MYLCFVSKSARRTLAVSVPASVARPSAGLGRSPLGADSFSTAFVHIESCTKNQVLKLNIDKVTVILDTQITRLANPHSTRSLPDLRPDLEASVYRAFAYMFGFHEFHISVKARPV
jgi:hypothetical protein